MTTTLPKYEPHTWWWHREPDGRHTLYPRMTFENLDPLPITDATLFLCVRCRVEGTAKVLTAMPCTDKEWYHGDIRAYRRMYTPRRCLGPDCAKEWVARVSDELNGMDCPRCGSLNTEEIPS